MRDDDSAPMNYYRAFRDIRDWLRPDDIIVGEGANTMDIGRTLMPNVNPRHRLDAGSYGTMGVGLGFAIAAAVTNPDQRVVMVQGDSAFGFSGMEFETMCRYQLPVIIVVLNNNGIGGGIDRAAHRRPAAAERLPADGAVREDHRGVRRRQLVRRGPGGPARRPRRGGSPRRPRHRPRPPRPDRRPQAPGPRLADPLTRARPKLLRL